LFPVWDSEVLRAKCPDERVSVHVSSDSELNFVEKNFKYEYMGFHDFLTRCVEETDGQKFYLRSLGDRPRKDPANIFTQLPDLASDLDLLSYLPPTGADLFSSVLRVTSSDLQIWTHYDVMDNYLVQIQGRKRVILFAPSETKNLYLVGDKSQVHDLNNPDYSKFPRMEGVEGYETTLVPGDMLFIPALWHHNCRSIDFSISINTFWKYLPSEEYDRKDVYGNADPVVGAKLLKAVDAACEDLSRLPEDHRLFFAQRAISLLESKLKLSNLQ